MTTISSICDLHDSRDALRHSHGKVLAFGCTCATFVLLLIAFLKNYVWTWPAVAALAVFLWAPWSADVIKALAKIKAAK